MPPPQPGHRCLGGGKQLLKNRQLTTLDEKELLNKAQTWRKKIKN